MAFTNEYKVAWGHYGCGWLNETMVSVKGFNEELGHYGCDWLNEKMALSMVCR